MCDEVRGSLTIMTTLKGARMSASVLAMHGSARTARTSAIRQLRSYLLEQSMLSGQESQKRQEKLFLRIEERLEKVRNMD